jgi:hypothetical protein
MRDELPHLYPIVVRYQKVPKGFILAAAEEYFDLYMTAYLFIFTLVVISVLESQISNEDLVLIIILSVCVGVFVTGTLFYWFRSSRLTGLTAVARIKRSIKFSILALTQSCGSILIYATPYILITTIDAGKEAHWPLVTLVFVLFMHCIAHLSVRSYIQTAAILTVPMILVWCIPFGPSIFGAMTLRLLGIGGGVPRTITLLEKGVEGSQPVVKTVHGCVLIAAGSQVVLHPENNPSACTVPALLSGASMNSLQWKVDIYPQSEVIKESRLSPSLPPQKDQK